MEAYRGEVYLAGEGTLGDFLVTPNKITANVESTENTLLVINQNSNPGWRTSVGSIVKNEKLITVLVPPGQHDVTLKYHPPGLILGLTLFAATILVYVGVEIWLKKTSP
jgi:uncharacterized membrane protein YfhO